MKKHAKVAYRPKSQPTYGITETMFYRGFGGRRTEVALAAKDKGHPLHDLAKQSPQLVLCK